MLHQVKEGPIQASRGAELVRVGARQFRRRVGAPRQGRRRCRRLGAQGQASEALKAYLDATWPTARVWVIGDFNDDVDTSISVGRPSPYAAFVADTPRWSFPTAALSAAGTGSTVRYPDPIDHHLVSNEALATYVSGSVEAYRVDVVIPEYSSTTSDHFPVLARYRVN